MRFRLTRRAERDLDDIAWYIAARSPAGARRVELQSQAALRIISAHPFVGREGRRGVRRFAVPRCPYLVFYGVDAPADELQVFTIRHTSRRPI